MAQESGRVIVGGLPSAFSGVASRLDCMDYFNEVSARTMRLHVALGVDALPFIYIAYMLLLGWAFFDGLARWWGTGSALGAIVFLACASIVPGGGFFISAVAFYGAYAAWRWEWWQAGLFAFPGFALTASVLLVSGTYFLWQTLFGRTGGWQGSPPATHIPSPHRSATPSTERPAPNPIPRKEGETTVDWEDIPQQARIALRFREDAEQAFERVRKLPEGYQRRFLSALDADPRMDVDALVEALEAEKLSEDNPFLSDECNLIYKSLNSISPAAAKEFKEAEHVLGDKFDPGRALLLTSRRYQIQYHSQLSSLMGKYSNNLSRRQFDMSDISKHELIGIANMLLYSHVIYPDARKRLSDIRSHLYTQELSDADRQFIVDLASEKGIL